MPRLKAIFSDIDGTLVHYAKDFQKHGVRLVSSDERALTAVVEGPDGDRRNCRLLPSSTLGPACISERTIELVEELRAVGVKFCVVTAARKSTMLRRWELLPTCDAHVCEGGSRIYIDGVPDVEFANRFMDICGPMDSKLEGADARPEPLWQFYRRLNEEMPELEMDSDSYYGMFRVGTKGDAAIESALRDKIESSLPSGISWSTNLGKYDFYPSAAGKGNAVKYLQEKFGVRQSETACLFDDDNYLPMAEQCGIHMLPGLTSESVKEAAAQQPSWKVAKTAGQGVFAIEECLEALVERAKLGNKDRVEAAQPSDDDVEALMREVEDATFGQAQIVPGERAKVQGTERRWHSNNK